ncbi:hypothetical protein T4D_4821 [Trichinella pseudospiralis]|uniref:Uncharacterized protein n=1 Tax=Trichinella pseudospiralis TaxID=6337 RepID=A0A0V1FHU1_TRIPS|nr:hypothetical protein T4D_4821 [Trichinella pseudospiralis]
MKQRQPQQATKTTNINCHATTATTTTVVAAIYDQKFLLSLAAMTTSWQRLVALVSVACSCGGIKVSSNAFCSRGGQGDVEETGRRIYKVEERKSKNVIRLLPLPTTTTAAATTITAAAAAAIADAILPLLVSYLERLLLLLNHAHSVAVPSATTIAAAYAYAYAYTYTFSMQHCNFTNAAAVRLHRRQFVGFNNRNIQILAIHVNDARKLLRLWTSKLQAVQIYSINQFYYFYKTLILPA